MTKTFIKRVTALRCPYHRSVMDEAIKDLSSKGVIRKEAIIKRLQMEAMEDSIRWDYVIGFIGKALEEVEKLMLIPVAQRWFTTPAAKRKSDEMSVQAKYLAGGKGRKTAGWVKVSMDDGKLALRKAEVMKAISDGKAKALQTWVTEAVANAIREGDEQLALDVQKVVPIKKTGTE